MKAPHPRNKGNLAIQITFGIVLILSSFSVGMLVNKYINSTVEKRVLERQKTIEKIVSSLIPTATPSPLPSSSQSIIIKTPTQVKTPAPTPTPSPTIENLRQVCENEMNIYKNTLMSKLVQASMKSPEYQKWVNTIYKEAIDAEMQRNVDNAGLQFFNDCLAGKKRLKDMTY